MLIVLTRKKNDNSKLLYFTGEAKDDSRVFIVT